MDNVQNCDGYTGPNGNTRAARADEAHTELPADLRIHTN
jgi:hypothetical protein